jgi:DNA-directed RNA polymerase alpha subunit
VLFQEKNGSNNNEMSQTEMASIENLKTALRGFELSCEFKNFPLTFVNALRRILLSSIPTVVVNDVEILKNTSQLPHEMLKHRVKMLPINVLPSDSSTIKDAKIELRVFPDPSENVRTLTTNDFVFESGREDLILKDRDLKTPLLFLRLRQNEEVHLKANLGIAVEGVSHLCNVSTSWHVDPERMKNDRKIWIEKGLDPREFDNFEYQKSYAVNEKNDPYWFDMSLESKGVMQTKDVLNLAVAILRKNVSDFMKEALDNIRRSEEKDTYVISVVNGGHTIGGLFQEVLYGDMNVRYVGYDIRHPLKTDMDIPLVTDKTPESVLKNARDSIEEYCKVLEKAL